MLGVTDSPLANCKAKQATVKHRVGMIVQVYYVCTMCILCVQIKTSVVSMRKRVPTNRVSGRTLQPSIESVVANSFVPSDFLVDGQVSGLGTVHPLLTLSFVSTWILPLHVVSSTLKRKSSSSVMDGLQRRRREGDVCKMCVLCEYNVRTVCALCVL